MTDHAAASAADLERDDRPAHAPSAADRRSEPDAPAPAPRLRMFGASDAPNCDGDGCVVPFAVNPNENTEGNPK